MMAAVVKYQDDPLRTFTRRSTAAFPTSDPYVRGEEFGVAGLVTYVIDEGRRTVTLTDVTWVG
jgi:hypothetical protein